MRLQQSRRDEPELNLTPLIDVVFLLLIFFMVSTTFTKESDITIDLPQSSSSEASRKDKPLEIVIDAKGQYFINDNKVINTDVKTLRNALKKLASGKKDQQLVIRADGKAPHQSVINAMDAARQLGMNRLTFATRQQDQ